MKQYAKKTQEALNVYIETKTYKDLLLLSDAINGLNGATDMLRDQLDIDTRALNRLDESFNETLPQIKALIKKEESKKPLPTTHELYRQNLVESAWANNIIDEHMNRLRNFIESRKTLNGQLEAYNVLLAWEKTILKYFDEKMKVSINEQEALNAKVRSMLDSSN